MIPKQHVIPQVVRLQRLLEPVDAVPCEHLRRAHSPLVVLWPEGVAGARINHEPGTGADRVSRCSHDCLVLGEAVTAKGPPTDLEGSKSLLLHGGQVLN